MKKKKEKEEMSYADRYREIGYKIAYCRKHMNLTNDILPTVTEINFYPCPQTAGNHIEETTPAPHSKDK